MGNVPTKWNGVPADVLKQYNIAYTEKELRECISFDDANANTNASPSSTTSSPSSISK
jgi:hypothetical protein